MLPLDSVVAGADLEAMEVERVGHPMQPAWAPEAAPGPGLGTEPANQSQMVTVAVLVGCQECPDWAEGLLQGQPTAKFRLKSSV